MGDVPLAKVNSPGGVGDQASVPEPRVASTSASETAVASQHQPQSRPANVKHGQYGSPTPLDMSNMAYSLPAHQSQRSPFDPPPPVHTYPSSTTAQGLIYPMQSMGPYPGPSGAGGLAYGMPYAPAYSPYPMPQHPHPGPAQHGGHYAPFVAGPPTQGVAMGHMPMYGAGYYHPAYGTPFGPGGYPIASQARQPAVARQTSRPPATSSPPKKEANKRVAEAEYDVSKTIVDGSNPSKVAPVPLSPLDLNPLARSTSTSSAPRGPPRKPKQSGHALWVGNLPPGASVVELKDHFAQDATHEIESVFLISKSNCAFVNYNSAASCAAALARFHDSRFQGVRLVCRLRKGVSLPGSGIRVESETGVPSGDDELPVVSDPAPLPPPEGPRLDRYFVVKSLTVEDLELSKQSGIWATQTHNEVNLNQAFENAEHVYLIFSANKSGEYFGYARMLSPINDDEELALEMPPRPEPATGPPDDLDVTMTTATATAPKGRIIDDPARGTIFWEVESIGDEKEDTRSEASVEGPVEDGEAESQSFGKPFRIQWLSTVRVPFHRTRGLRNPWNANREVKIARDGTEIEPTVGRKLIQLFHV